ncbi:hypothetical protein JCM8097_007070 [Rhodosporidiobolus ruineniae]
MATVSKKDLSSIELPLTPGRKQEKLNFWQTLNFAIILPLHLFVFLPLRIFASHFALRLFSPTVRKVGRPLFADALSKLVQFFYSRCSVPQARIAFNSTTSYALTYAFRPAFRDRKDWVKEVKAYGVSGRWVAKPGTSRKDDDAVLYYIHGGGFTTDTGSAAQEVLLKTITALKEKQSVSASAFSLNYHLAPEYKYPTQLVEVLAGYHYLVNELHIAPERIVLVGDSAGGNLISAFLLHLARPAKGISVPSELGSTPGKPGGALLISPEVKFASLSKSTYTNIAFDLTSMGFIFRGACDYIGARMPFTHRFRTRWMLNPLWHLVDPQRLPPVPAEKLADYEGWVGWNKIENIELFKSPYVQPGVNTDGEWWKEALPAEGKTVVAWGGLEVLRDDIDAFYHQLEKAGVQPGKLYKELGVHNWPVFDLAIPQLWQTKSKGPDAAYEYGLKAIVELVRQVASDATASSAKSSKPTSDTPSAVSTAVDEPLAGSNAEAAKRAKAVHAFKQKPEPEPPVKGKSFADAAARDEYIADNAPIVVKGEGKTLEAHLEDGKLVAERAVPGDEKKKEATLPPIPIPKPTVDLSPPRAPKKKEPEVKITKPKKESKPVPPVPAPEEGGSYAAAASSKGIAEDAPVVAKGEGDSLQPQLTDGHVGAQVAHTKAESAAKNGGSAAAAGGSWAKVAASTEEVDEDSLIVAEGEGDKLKPTLADGSLHATAA